MAVSSQLAMVVTNSLAMFESTTHQQASGIDDTTVRNWNPATHASLS